MLESPAYRVLSLSARKILDRIEIELAHHGGNENGRLPVTYDDFVAYGIHRHAIAPALREVDALGFIEITERGRAGNAEYRSPNKIRITYRHLDKAKPTDEWKRIATLEEAEAIAHEARQPLPKAKRRKNFPVTENATFQCRKPSLKTGNSQCRKPSLQP